ncbi:putative RNA-directed DNA polymerase [Helianthus annuus]|nr:putative RNA-directed DNA polymerase [Helianthus annuus]
MASSSTTLTTSLHHLLHFIPHKLTSSNYLAWSQQVKLVLSLQTLLGHIDGTTKPPAETTTADDKTSPNPDYATWLANDQAVRLLIQSSLSEEAMSEVIGLHTARQIWLSLEAAYSHPSIDRMHTLRDNLRLLQKGSSTVAEFGRKFKALCDQLAAIGHPVDESDKCHWFLCGLGPAYEHFSTTYRAVGISSFRELLAKTENQEIFIQSLHGQQTPPVAFTAQPLRSGNSRSNSGSTYSNRGRGRGRGAGRGRTRRPPHCQLCRTEGHYANTCPNLASFAKQASSADANLAHAFHAQCHVTHEDHPDWAGDTGASAHMTPYLKDLDATFRSSMHDFVRFGNGHTLPVTNIGTTSLTKNIHLKNVLVVPHLTKRLLSISKLTHDSPVDVLFSNNFFSHSGSKIKGDPSKGNL